MNGGLDGLLGGRAAALAERAAAELAATHERRATSRAAAAAEQLRSCARTGRSSGRARLRRCRIGGRRCSASPAAGGGAARCSRRCALYWRLRGRQGATDVQRHRARRAAGRGNEVALRLDGQPASDAVPRGSASRSASRRRSTSAPVPRDSGGGSRCSACTPLAAAAPVPGASSRSACDAGRERVLAAPDRRRGGRSLEAARRTATRRSRGRSRSSAPGRRSAGRAPAGAGDRTRGQLLQRRPRQHDAGRDAARARRAADARHRDFAGPWSIEHETAAPARGAGRDHRRGAGSSSSRCAPTCAPAGTTVRGDRYGARRQRAHRHLPLPRRRDRVAAARGARAGPDGLRGRGAGERTARRHGRADAALHVLGGHPPARSRRCWRRRGSAIGSLTYPLRQFQVQRLLAERYPDLRDLQYSCWELTATRPAAAAARSAAESR